MLNVVVANSNRVVGVRAERCRGELEQRPPRAAYDRWIGANKIVLQHAQMARTTTVPY